MQSIPRQLQSTRICPFCKTGSKVRVSGHVGIDALEGSGKRRAGEGTGPQRPRPQRLKVSSGFDLSRSMVFARTAGSGATRPSASLWANVS